MIAGLALEYNRLRGCQWKQSDALGTVQLAKLKRQLEVAARYSGFYQRKFEQTGFKVEDFCRLEDLQRLPILAKGDLQAAGEGLYSTNQDLKDCVWMRTSGSSGSPIALPFNPLDKSLRVLKELRALQANGYAFRDIMLCIVEPRSMVEDKAVIQRLGFLRREYASIYEEPDDLISRINTLKPAVIYGYTSSLRIIAEKLKASGGLKYRPKILVSAAELMNATARRLLEEGFGIRPVDFYGSMEFGWIAWQCPERNGYHVNSDCVIVECLKYGRPAEAGHEGELVVTNLHSDAAPLIRYATGDVGVLSDQSCACGRTLPLLVSVNGRLADCLTLPDGEQLSPYVVTCAVEEVPGVRRFQVVQDEARSINVLLLDAEGLVDLEHVRRVVSEALHGRVSVTVQVTQTLDNEPSGKFRVVKSNAQVPRNQTV